MVEKESDGQLPFLDILRNLDEDSNTSISLYRKETNTHQYLSFQSHHPAAHKRAVGKTHMCRAEVLPSSGVSRAQEKHGPGPPEEEWVPSGFHPQANLSTPNQTSVCDHETHATLTLPYFNGLSDSIHRVLAPLAIQVTIRPYGRS